MLGFGTKIIKTNNLYDIILFHDSGSTAEINNISDDVLEFIKKNLGRDKILITDSIYLNLSKFSLIKFNKK